MHKAYNYRKTFWQKSKAYRDVLVFLTHTVAIRIQVETESNCFRDFVDQHCDYYQNTHVTLDSKHAHFNHVVTQEKERVCLR